MTLHDFRVLTFDCYGTLIDWEAGLLAALRPWLARAGVTLEDDALLAAFAAVESPVQAERPGLAYPEVLAESHRRLARNLGIAADEAAARGFGASVGDWPAFPDSPAALAYLKQHYRLVILSNIDRASFALSNKRLGVEFDAVCTAEEIGSYKPDRRNFEFAIARVAKLGFGRDAILHTAQSLYHDIVPAKALGLATMWINRRQGKAGGATPTASGDATPDFEVPTLAAFADRHRAGRG